MKKIKKYILAAIPAVLLTFILGKILNPILDFLYSLFLDIGSFFIKSFSDSTYKTISRGYSELPSLWLLYFVIIILFLILMGFLLWLDFQHDQTENHIHELKKKNNLLIQEVKINAESKTARVSNEEISDDDTLSTLLETEKDIEYLEDSISESYKKRKFTMKLFIVIFLSVMFFLYAQQNFINNAIAKALSNIEIVSPYITDNEYKHLKSTFYSINNREDYNSLFNTLEEIANTNSIDLKK